VEPGIETIQRTDDFRLRGDTPNAILRGSMAAPGGWRVLNGINGIRLHDDRLRVLDVRGVNPDGSVSGSNYFPVTTVGAAVVFRVLVGLATGYSGPMPHPPILAPDALEILNPHPGVEASVTPLSNDSAIPASNNSLRITRVYPNPTIVGGNRVTLGPGYVRYRVENGQFTQDAFLYDVCDNYEYCSSGGTVDVYARNNVGTYEYPPVVVGDLIFVNQNQSYTIDPAENDYDPEDPGCPGEHCRTGSGLLSLSMEAPEQCVEGCGPINVPGSGYLAHGTLEWVGGRNLRYTSNDGQRDEFQYRVCNPGRRCSIGTVRVNQRVI
jgi:hypothetical protein